MQRPKNVQIPWYEKRPRTKQTPWQRHDLSLENICHFLFQILYIYNIYFTWYTVQCILNSHGFIGKFRIIKKRQNICCQDSIKIDTRPIENKSHSRRSKGTVLQDFPPLIYAKVFLNAVVSISRRYCIGIKSSKSRKKFLG